MPAVNRETWPATYDLEERDGKAVLPMDFFPTCCPGQLDNAWAARTVKYRPYFESAAVQSGIVNKNHRCGENIPENVAEWKAMVQKQILGKKYRERMKSGWNSAIERLTGNNGDDAMGGHSDAGPDFSFDGHRPICQEDVGNVLFGEKVRKMVKNGELEQPMALLFMWGYYLTMEGCSFKWDIEATNQYIQDNEYNVVLGNKCAGGKSMTIHCWVRIGTKVSVNSFQTTLRKQQIKIWGVTFEGSLKIDEGAVNDKESNLELVDIGEYLPAKVKADMGRVNNTRFMVKRHREEMVDLDELMRMKVAKLYSWADREGVPREDIYKVMTEMKDDIQSSGGDEAMGGGG
jgi:DNA-binding Lrp family transcriptional regulator